MATMNAINTSAITLGGPFTTTIADLTLTLTGSTNVTLPTTGTLVNTAVTTLSSLTSIGTISSGIWNGTVIVGQYGGTGVANTGKTITIGGNFVTSGAFAATLTLTNTTNVTLPTTGTLVNTAVTTLSSLVSIGTITTGVWNGTIITGTFGGTGVNNGANTITLGGGNLALSGADDITFTTSGVTSVTLPITGTLITSTVTTLSSLVSIGTITTGTWNATVVAGQYGGTGVANTGKTITLGGNLTTSGAFASTFTMTNTTAVTFPTTGTLVNSAVTTLSSLVSIGTITTGVWNGTIITGTFGGTGVNNGASTITLGGNLVTSGANSLTFTTTGATNVTVPTTGTLATTSQFFNWANNSTASITMAVNTGYSNNNGATLGTYTLPVTASFGDMIRISGRGAGGWTIAQNAGQSIAFGSISTTSGVTGSLSSTNAGDCVELLCTTSNNAFRVISSVGNLTYV